ncbi:DUF4153 domain-containing protein [Rodentibacter haemolyticus]|uniref:DUF4153 domain-containing protein n=1 Tax=Rodentibacter haemolyticus TaxID=2778911 RepID=A0ABX6UW64_9PAST|nr:DUF4153 domain-containing protein [Rodentibacter haemolyticus]QPB42067.1 DUF4153 domain-containing protein [Rodentibacter haemolyticus]
MNNILQEKFISVFRQHYLIVILLAVFNTIFVLSTYSFMKENYNVLLFFPFLFSLVYLTRNNTKLHFYSFVLALFCALIIYSLKFELKLEQFIVLDSILLFCVLFDGWEKNNRNFILNANGNVFRLVKSCILAGLIYSFLLLTLGAIYYLFNVRFYETIYLRLALFSIFFIIPFSYLLFSNKKEEKFPKFLQLIIQFVISPYIILYTFLLYAYLIYIISSNELPRGGVAYLVTAFLACGIIARALQLLLNNPKWKLFYRFFSYLTFAPLVLLWLGIYVRVSNYGLTTYRIYLIVIAFILTFYSIYSLFPNKFQYRYWCGISLIFLGFISFVVTPEKISIENQAFRFYQQLNEMGLLDKKGKIINRLDLNRVNKLDPSSDEYQRYVKLSNMAIYLGGNENYRNIMIQQYGEGFDEIFYFRKPYSKPRVQPLETLINHYFNKEKLTYRVKLSSYGELVHIKNYFEFDYTNLSDLQKQYDVKIKLGNNSSLSINLAEILKRVFKKHNLDITELQSTQDLDKLTNDILTIHTKKGLLILDSARLAYIENVGYVWMSGFSSYFLLAK